MPQSLVNESTDIAVHARPTAIGASGDRTCLVTNLEDIIFAISHIRCVRVDVHIEVDSLQTLPFGKRACILFPHPFHAYQQIHYRRSSADLSCWEIHRAAHERADNVGFFPRPVRSGQEGRIEVVDIKIHGYTTDFLRVMAADDRYRI